MTTESRPTAKDGLRAQIKTLVRDYAALEFAPRAFVPGETPIPCAGRVIGAEELELMVEASLDGWLTTGRFNEAFERELAQYLGARHVLSVNSGSSANLVAVSSLTSPNLGDRAVGPGDEILTVAASFPTTVNPILQIGAVPVFVDVDIGTYNVNTAALAAAIGPKTRAIVLAHILGIPFDLDAVTALCRRHRLWLVEDCCDALGSTWRGRMVGTFGDIGTQSFFPAHHITMGEGGAVFTDNAQLHRIAQSLRDWGRDCICAPGHDNTCGDRYRTKIGSLPEGFDHKYVYSHVGYNLKITDMQAACGVAQIARLPEFGRRRRENFQYLHERLQVHAEHLILPSAPPGSDPSWFAYPITLRATAPVSRLDMLLYLERCKIGTRLLFAGNLTRQPSFAGRHFRISGELRNTDTIMNQTFWVGVYPALTNDMLDYMADRIGACLNGRTGR